MKFRLSALVAAMCVLWAGAAQAQSDFAIFSAVINADGTAEEDSGLQSSTRVGTGNYVLTFAREVDGCSVVAAPRGSRCTSRAGPVALSAVLTSVTVPLVIPFPLLTT